MRFAAIPNNVAYAGLRALKTVCMTDGVMSPLEASFLDGVQRHIMRSDFDLDALAPITGEELAAAVPPGELRERVVGGMVIAACIDGDASPAEMAVVDRFAAALDIAPAILATGRHLANDRLVLARIDIGRRALPGYEIGGVLREEGLPGLIKQILPMLGVANDKTAARYRALGESAEGSLGRAYFDFITENQFSFPGEKYAGPEIIVAHDILHVLGGYGTTAEEEVQVAAFQAGCHDENHFHALLFVLAQFHLGVSMTPVSTAERLKADPELMVKALARGAKVSRDMWSDFDPWQHFARPLEEVRRELNIEPR